jgi:hypothetical protein
MVYGEIGRPIKYNATLSPPCQSRTHLVEDIVDERVHDAHGFRADAGVGVYLL